MIPFSSTTLKSLTQNLNSLDLCAVADLLHYCSCRSSGGHTVFFNIGRQLHARLILSSILPSNFLASKLLTFYSRSGHLSSARHVFDQIPEKNIFAYNAMLIAYSFHSSSPSLVSLFASLPPSLKPDAFTLSSLLTSISSLSSSKETHTFALRHSFLQSDLFVANALLSAYARCGHFQYAKILFDKMPTRDVVSWNALLSAYSQAGLHGDCLALYANMEKGPDSIKPNGVTVATVLHTCTQTNDLAAGRHVHCVAVENEVEMDSVVWNSLIGFYAKCGSLHYARSLFDGMPDRDAVSYNAMITGYMSQGFVEEAMHLFYCIENPVISSWNAVIAGLVQNNCHDNVLELVRAMQESGFRPNSVTISSFLPAVSFYSSLSAGKHVHCYTIRNECDQNIYVSTALMDIYAKAGFLIGARRVFERTMGRSVIIWTAIISAYSSHGDADAAVALFNEMLDTGTRPDLVTFTAVLSACSHAGEVDEAHRIFDMMAEFEIEPAVEHYACLVGVFSRRGMLKEAVEFVEKMPVEPTPKVWGALLNGAAVFGDVEVGEFVFEKLVEMEPDNTGNYIVMANLYSGARKWEESKSTREKMRGIGLAKVPGCSWIEMGNELRVFVARDELSEFKEEIYALLEGLVRLMRKESWPSKDEFDEERFC